MTSAPLGGVRAGPVVTIGIPAYNRPALLRRAVDSALAQRDVSIEVLISDDASPDPDVQDVLRDLAGTDPRVRVARQSRNLGHAANYQWVLNAAAGEYFMWLSDDDWIDPGYVEGCLAALAQDRGAVLVCGVASYYQDGVHVVDERPIDLTSSRPGLRVIRYFGRVSLNGPLFGVARRDRWLQIGFPPVIGGDWMLVAELAARGRVRTIGAAHIHRSLTGLGSDATSLGLGFGLSKAAASQHHVLVAARVWRDIATGAGDFRRIAPVGRVLVASAAAALIVTRFTLAGLLRRVLGPSLANRLERAVSNWLRARESR
jgi:glycosyltransferase involved in cell wall biosynthesis